MAWLTITYLVLGSVAHAEDLDKIVAFDIQAQSLDKALLEFGAQAHVQIMLAWTSETAHLRAPALRGKYSCRQALLLLLRGTPLGFAHHGNTVEITRLSDPPDTSKPRAIGPDTSPSSPITSLTSSPEAPPPESTTSTVNAALHEVIVTAQKYQQSAFNVPISLEVLTSRELQQRGVTNLNTLQYSVPGLTVEGGGAQRRIDIRGIGSAFGNGALIGTYLDEADVTPEGQAGAYGFGQLDAQTYDLARVEVLRGPQGTLYGDGSMGGVIRLVTNQPVLNQFQMNADMAALFTQDGAPSQRIQAMINTPLITDTVGLRLAGDFDHEGGWIDEPAARVKNFNDQNLLDVRLEGLWEPSSTLRLSATQLIHRNSYGLDMGEDSANNYTQLYGLDTIPNGTENYNISNLTITYDLGWAQALSSTTYFNHYIASHNEAENLPFGAVTYWYYFPSFVVTDESSSEELRLSNATNSRWTWTIGGFYKHFGDNETYPFAFTLAGAPFPAALGLIDQSTGSNSLAGFLDTSYKVTRRMTLGAGLRYFSDRETYSVAGSPFQARTFVSTDPRVFLQYQLSADVNTYLSAAKGFRSGGFNPTPYSPYDPESLRTYEVGTKIRLPTSRIRASADVFYSEYSNVVVVGFLSSTNHANVSSNAGNARIRGFEGDVLWEPIGGWSFGINGDYLDTYFVSAVAGGNYQLGDQLPFVSKYMVTVSLERDFQLNNVPGHFRVGYSELAPQSYRGHNNILDESDLMHMLSAGVDLRLNSNLDVGVFAENLLNERGYQDPLHLYLIASRQRPRTVGVNFRVGFP